AADLPLRPPTVRTLQRPARAFVFLPARRCLTQLSGRDSKGVAMCRNIKTLFNFEPPATEEEIRASSLQFVRKLSGFTSPSRANRAAFDRAVEEVAAAARRLIESLVTSADPRDRDIEAARAKAKSAERFGLAAGGQSPQPPFPERPRRRRD